MKTRQCLVAVASVLMFSFNALSAEQPWQKMSDPTAAEVAANFKSPPPENANSVCWGWNGPMSEEVITRDLDTLHARGLRIVTIEPGYHMDNAPYLSEEYFKLIRFAVEQARNRGMRVIIIDEGKYPSGFVNGKYTRERPELRMKALAQPQRESVTAGETISRDVSADTVSAVAFNADDGKIQLLDVNSGKLQWTVPATGHWQIVTDRWLFATPDTRAISDPTQAKTKANSMGDLIDKEAAGLFIEWTHEQYKKHMGDLFGNAIIAFRGDEPEMTGVPWTPKIAEEFQKAKGYDVRPYLPFFVTGRGAGNQMTDEQRRAKADYFDVWSELFAEYFFDAQADWCAANGIEATGHLNNDHNMPALVQTTGDYFRMYRKTQIPGVDTIWNQVWPGTVADFIKFPTSAAHMNGRPRAFAESFAAYTPTAGIEEARFGVNYMMVRGINLFEFMFYSSSVPRAGGPAPASAPARGARGARAATPGAGTAGQPYMPDEKFPALATYTNRMTYVLAQGRPAAQIGIYVPTMSMWLGDSTGNASMMKIARGLSENQRDYDFVDEQALAANMKLRGDQFVNASGQSYRAVLIPTSTAISKAALDRLQTFAKAGGKVMFLGKEPSLVVEKTFLHAQPMGDLAWATLREPSGDVTDAVLAALPKADVGFDKACPTVKAMHRKWHDSDVYFFFNESDAPREVVASVAETGTAKAWDAYSAQIENLSNTTTKEGQLRLPMTFEPYGARLIVIGPATSVARRD